MLRNIAAFGVVAALLAVMAGLSSPQATAATPKFSLKHAVTAYSNAYLGGDGAKAYSLLSKRCEHFIDEATLESYADAAKSLYGKLRIKSFKAKIVNARSARVTYTYVVHRLDQKNQSWVKQGGRWRYNDC